MFKGSFYRLEEIENGDASLDNYRKLLRNGSGVVADMQGNIKAHINENKVMCFDKMHALSNLLTSDSAVFYRKFGEKKFEIGYKNGNGYDKKIEYAQENFFDDSPSLMIINDYTRPDDELALISTKLKCVEEKFRTEIRI